VTTVSSTPLSGPRRRGKDGLSAMIVLVHKGGITVANPTIPLDRLRSDFDGRAIAPGDAGYDDARRVFAGTVDRRPAVILRVANSDEVAAVIRLARETGLDLAVRSGGHSGAGHGVCEGGIVLDLSPMRALDIDVDGRTAWAETGLTAVEYTTAVGAHGLATGFGDTGSVGIGGITLGGGVGYLARRYGLTIDDLLAADVVTADGELLRVDADNHPDLFWGIRGGGGNFGVATRFQFRLHEVPTVVGGMLMLPASAEIVHGFIAAAEAAPAELFTICNVMPAPPVPFLPPERHGEILIMALLCYAGPAEAGERALAPFRGLATPIVDMTQAMPYPGIYPPDDPDYRPTAASRTFFLDEVTPAATELIMERLEASDASLRVAQLRVLGGAIADVPDDATAYAHRGRRLMGNVAAFFAGPQDQPIREQWVTDLSAALTSGDDAAYVNFLGEDGPARIRAAYPGSTWDRLVAVKDRYDPTNLFRLNQNIPPSRRGE
jgi:FAD/FMN-containing dehydrogenase